MIVQRDLNKLQHKYNIHGHIGEINSGQTLVEMAGYRRPKDIIDSLTKAGERLAEYRRYKYQYQSDNKLEKLLNTQRKDYDIIDFEEDADKLIMDFNENEKVDKNKDVENKEVEIEKEIKEEKIIDNE